MPVSGAIDNAIAGTWEGPCEIYQLGVREVSRDRCAVSGRRAAHTLLVLYEIWMGFVT